MSTIKPKIGICPDCDNGIEVPLIAGHCQSHYWSRRREKNAHNIKPEKKVQKPIARRSKKRTIEELQYNSDRIIFLAKPENQICPITKQQTTEVHHQKGRIGKLLLDQRFWIALSTEGHRQVELNPEWAKENGFSLSRLENDNEDGDFFPW